MGDTGMSKSKTYTYELPSGATIYIESEDTGERGARDVSMEKAKEWLLSEVLQPIGEVAQVVFEAVKSKISQPDQITLEFGATLKGGTHLFLVSGNTEATFKVTLSWKKAQ